MAMKRCPTCGEKYSDTYKTCPFCEEEAAMSEGGEIRRGVMNHRGKNSPNWLSPMLIVLILLMAALLVYLVFGERIATYFQKDNAPSTDITETDPTPPSLDDNTAIGDGETTGDGQTETGSDTVDGDSTDPAAPTVPSDNTASSGMTYAQAAALPAGLTLNKTDFTLSKSGETYRLKASGSSGTYHWFSEDEGVASVSSDGTVTAISNGNIQVVVTDGQKQGTCTVRVRIAGGSTASSSGSSSSTGSTSGGALTLNRTDMTLKNGETFQLKASGSSSVSWSTSNSGVATVSGDGTVKAVGSGTATVTVSGNGVTAKCIVRVK